MIFNPEDIVNVYYLQPMGPGLSIEIQEKARLIKDYPEQGSWFCQLLEGVHKGAKINVDYAKISAISKLESFGFEVALAKLKEHKKVRRLGWGDSLEASRINQKFIGLVPEDSLKTSYLAIVYPFGHKKYPKGLVSPWTPTRCDLLEEDWYEI